MIQEAFNEAVEASGPNALSPEQLSMIDVDVLVWMAWDGRVDTVEALDLRTSLRAYNEGREAIAGEFLTAALTVNNPLSFLYAIEHLVPELEAAVDGDPATKVPSMVAAGLVQ